MRMATSRLQEAQPECCRKRNPNVATLKTGTEILTRKVWRARYIPAPKGYR